MKYPLNERMSKIRDLINSPRKQNTLLQDSTLWAMLCSCMDTIEDTEEALESFLKRDSDISDEGKNYLCIYGALQALIIQQEAVGNLHEALSASYTEDSSLKKSGIFALMLLDTQQIEVTKKHLTSLTVAL